MQAFEEGDVGCPGASIESAGGALAPWPQSSRRHPEDLATGFAFSIDQVGRGDLEAGIERFDGCIADDYIQAVRERGRWKVRSEVIVGTAFLNSDGVPVGT